PCRAAPGLSGTRALGESRSETDEEDLPVCRLLGYVADRPTSMVDVLGEDDFERFTALTAVHGDGWGMAWLDDDGDEGVVRVASSPDSASDDPAYEELARTPL